MEETIDIAEVARRTGLTLRALRFYEARGLVRPLRTAGGHRLYGARDLERLAAVVALKRAGFPLSEIGRLLGGRVPDLGRLVAARLGEVEAAAAAIAATRSLLLTVQSRIDRGEPIDVATLCSLIAKGDTLMQPEDWKTVTDRYFTPEQQAHWAERMKDLPAGFDQDDYDARWADLGTRIAGALPMDPASPQAQGFYDEWQALLAPFTAVATPEMMAGASALYDRLPEWQGAAGAAQAPFGAEVWTFVKAAAAARRAG